MNLNVNEWKEFFINRTKNHCGLFEIQPCKCGNAGNLDDGNDLYYIGAKKNDNGIMKKVKADKNLISKGNGIIFICDGEGSVGYTNYMPMDFIGSTTISIGYDDNLNAINGMFLVTILDMEKYKFSYGRKYRQHINEIKIKLPVCLDKNKQPIIDTTYKYSKEGYIPDFEFMENYIKSLQHKPLTTTIQQEFTPTLNITEWKEHKIGDIFKKVKVKKYSAIPEIDGDNYFISSTSSNNGVAKKVDEPTIKGNCITVSTNGDCFDCFYHSDRIVVSNDVEVLYNKNLNPFIALFICTILKAEKCKWSYGRKPKNNKVYETTIKLPTTPSGEPDWKWMENYIKSLPYSDKL